MNASGEWDINSAQLSLCRVMPTRQSDSSIVFRWKKPVNSRVRYIVIERRTRSVSQNASLPSILSKSLRHVIRSFWRWMRSWRIDVRLRCFGKWCFYICIASIRSVFSSSLPLVYLFLSLNVCLGITVFLEPFLNGGLLFSRKSPTVTEN